MLEMIFANRLENLAVNNKLLPGRQFSGPGKSTTNALELLAGSIPKGSPLSPILFMLFTAGFLEALERAWYVEDP